MNRAQSIKRLGWTAATAFSLAGATAPPAFGQVKSATKPAADAVSAPAAPGLAGLSDDALLSELAGRQMKGLLEHAFAASKIPEQKRTAMLALAALNRLGDAANPPQPFERVRLINQFAAGVDDILPAVNNPRVLVENTTTLIKFGVEPEVNAMEYWGETPQAQKRLAPVIAAVMKMLDKAVVLATAERNRAEELLNADRSPKIETQWNDADTLVTTAEFTRAMVTYNAAMALPNTGKGLEQRKKLADKASDFLQSYDNADAGVQAAVRNRMAKLNMVKREYGPANDLFESVAGGKVDDKTRIEPAPTAFEQYEARYFSVVCEMMQGDLPRATKGLDDLVAWQKTAVPNPDVQRDLAATAEVLRSRILFKQRDKADSAEAKNAAEDKAMAVLLELYNQRKDLRANIAAQLVDAVGDNVDVKNQNILILQAMADKALAAMPAFGLKAPSAAMKKEMDRGIAAAREILARESKDKGVTPEIVSSASGTIPVLYQAMDQKVAAADGYIDYIEKNRGDAGKQKGAFNEAGSLLLPLVSDPTTKGDAALSQAWERFLPIAVDKFGRKDFAYEYAGRLRSKQKFADAIRYYQQVPKDGKIYPTAMYRMMVTMTDLLYAVGPDKKPLLKPDARAALLKQTLAAAEEVKRESLAAVDKATDQKDKSAIQSRVAVVTLTQAELAASGDKPDWQNVLALLENFEKQSAGLENEAALNKKVMELRVAGNMQLKQFNKAAEGLIALLAKEPGGRAAGLVLGIVQQLRNDYDRSTAEGKKDAARDIAGNLANLTGFLVKWASDSKDPNVNKNLYLYKVYDADTQRIYGTSLDGEQRTAQLKKAMEAFQAMRTPENVAAYEASVAERQKDNPRDKTDPDASDPSVTLGMALTSYDLQDWKTAATELKKLRFAGKIGTRSRPEVDAKTGEAKIVPNEQYWEAMYKYYNAVSQWASGAPQDEDARKELDAVKTLMRRDYVAGADDVGGTKWREEFESLRKTLVPDLNVDELRQAVNGAPTAAPASASEPAQPPATAPVESSSK